MEPNKLEQQIKQKLEGRFIQPSANSWGRLDAMLAIEEKPKKKSFVWYYVAASLFFVLSISYWYLDQNTNVVIPQNTIVTTHKDEPLESNEKVNSNKNEIKENELIEEIQPIANSVIVQNKAVKKKTVQIENNEMVALNDKHEIQLIENNHQLATNNQFKFVSLEKLLASIENGNENKTITNSIKSKNDLKVNANSLLTSVEEELTKEYRETTFDKLARKLNQAKTAIANRNYE